MDEGPIHLEESLVETIRIRTVGDTHNCLLDLYDWVFTIDNQVIDAPLFVLYNEKPVVGIFLRDDEAHIPSPITNGLKNFGLPFHRSGIHNVRRFNEEESKTLTEMGLPNDERQSGRIVEMFLDALVRRIQPFRHGARNLALIVIIFKTVLMILLHEPSIGRFDGVPIASDRNL